MDKPEFQTPEGKAVAEALRASGVVTDGSDGCHFIAIEDFVHWFPSVNYSGPVLSQEIYQSGAAVPNFSEENRFWKRHPVHTHDVDWK